MRPFLEVSVPLKPHGKGRPRRGANGTMYTPDATVEWETSAAESMRTAFGEHQPVAVPVCLEVRAVWQGKGAVRGWYARKPDFDNVLKSVADALVQAGVIKDDAQVVYGAVWKLEAPAGDPTCVRVSVFVAPARP